MRRTIALFFIAFLFVGCARGVGYTVKIDSICSPDADFKKKYILMSGLKDVPVTDLQFKEYANYLDKALSSVGYLKTNDFPEADVVIFLVYGLGNPQVEHYSYSIPIWGQTGVSSSTTYGTVSPYGTYSGTTSYTPTYGITGYIPTTGSVTTYLRYFILDALDLNEFKRTEKVISLWRTTVTSIGTSDDLRRAFPVMVAASKPYLGINTNKQIEVRLREKSEAVLEIMDYKK